MISSADATRDDSPREFASGILDIIVWLTACYSMSLIPKGDWQETYAC